MKKTIKDFRFDGYRRPEAFALDLMSKTDILQGSSPVGSSTTELEPTDYEGKEGWN